MCDGRRANTFSNIVCDDLDFLNRNLQVSLLLWQRGLACDTRPEGQTESLQQQLLD